MNDIFWTWLISEYNHQVYNVIAPTAFAPVVPADPSRFAVSIQSNAGTTTFVSFGRQIPGNFSFQLQGFTSLPLLLLRDLGGLIREPIQARSNSGTNTLLITTLSFTDDRRRIYDEYVRRVIPKQDTL